ncbi:hypothetical protein [Metallosphaera sp.]|uniref:hypothetical protein n=1 Tax=Metallosphaera sp. TaxID=2020860 RepID=UPI0027995578|nr:hypothetical protein [Saccharolobus shibatae filamentous virus 3]WHA35225.1 hypothetical protein SSRV2_ORF50 [Saccharolobus shibatae rod virus 2]
MPEHEDEVKQLREILDDKSPRRNGNYLESLVHSIEEMIPSSVSHEINLFVNNDLDILIIKNGKLMVGKSLNDCKPIKEYVNGDNVTSLYNTLLLFKSMLPGYVELWTKKESKDAEDVLKDILG